jgi:hypothetical protein
MPKFKEFAQNRRLKWLVPHRPREELHMVTDQEIRLEALRSATRAADGHSINNILIHADWASQFVKTGLFPAASELPVARMVVVGE